MTKKTFHRWEVRLPKHFEVAIVGNRLDPDLAHEIIRRTDHVFVYGPSIWDLSSYEAGIGARLGYPVWNHDFGAASDLSAEQQEAAERVAYARYAVQQAVWQRTWGVVDAGFLKTNYLGDTLGGPRGWCHPDGTICHLELVRGGRNIHATHYLNWARLVAGAFPFLEMTIAFWTNDTFGQVRDTSGMNLLDVHAPPRPISGDPFAALEPPQIGIVLQGGKARFVNGTDPALLTHLDMDLLDFVEEASRRHFIPVTSTAPSEFGARHPGNKLPDQVIHRWIKLAGTLNLV